jgi:hypothetical protein
MKKHALAKQEREPIDRYSTTLLPPVNSCWTMPLKWDKDWRNQTWDVRFGWDKAGKSQPTRRCSNSILSSLDRCDLACGLGYLSCDLWSSSCGLWETVFGLWVLSFSRRIPSCICYRSSDNLCHLCPHSASLSSDRVIFQPRRPHDAHTYNHCIVYPLLWSPDDGFWKCLTCSTLYIMWQSVTHKTV